MRNNKFISATLILMLSGFITKILGMIIRILYTRIITETGISLYSLITPTYSLLLTIAILSMPYAISKLVAESKIKSKNILSTATIILLTMNVLLIVITILSSKFIAIHLLKNQEVYGLLIICSLTLPFISLSSILKGYFYGKQNMVPNALSNIIEQIIKILLIIFLLPIFIEKSIISGVKFLIGINIITEISSILVFTIFIPNKNKINLKDIKPNQEIARNILDIIVPSVSGKLIGNIGYFLEPIILTNILLYTGFSKDTIILEYGYYNAYTISLLLMPSFFINAIAQSLLPEISKYKSKNNNLMLKKRIKQGIIFTMITGFIFSLTIFTFRYELLNILYKTSNGADYIKVLAPFFILFYLEAPLTTILIAFNKVKESTIISTLGMIIKLVVMILLGLNHFGIYSLIYSEIINIIFIIILDIKYIKKELKLLN